MIHFDFVPHCILIVPFVKIVVIVHGFLLYGLSALQEDTMLLHQNLIANLVIIINLCAVLACCVEIRFALPIISNFVPVGYKWYVEEHVVSKYCCAWRGFKDCVIGRENGSCRVFKDDINVIGGY